MVLYYLGYSGYIVTEYMQVPVLVPCKVLAYVQSLTAVPEYRGAWHKTRPKRTV